MTLDLSGATWEYYSETLGRSVIPDEATFTRFALAPSLWLDGLYTDGLVVQKEDDGYICAVCMMAEEDYKASLAEGDGGQVLAGESLGDYSWSGGSSSDGLSQEERVARQRMKWLRLYCYVVPGVR